MKRASLEDLAAFRADLVASHGEPSRRDRDGERPRRKRPGRDRPQDQSRAFRLPADFPFEASPADVEAHIDAVVVAHYPRVQQGLVADILADEETTLVAPPVLVQQVWALRRVASRRVHDLYLSVPRRDPDVVRLRQRDRWEGPCSQVVTKRADGTYWVDGQRVSPQKATGLLRSRQDREPTPIAYR